MRDNWPNLIDVLVQIYKDEDLFAAQLELLQNTNMVDFATDIYTKRFGVEAPEGSGFFFRCDSFICLAKEKAHY